MTEQTFLFADLSGFTALTEAHGDQAAADLAGNFSEVVRDALLGTEGHLVKTIGDAVMLRIPRASDAVRVGLDIVHAVRRQPLFPEVHVGMHTGPAVKRGRDWFGGSVNIAARVASAAGSDEVLLTQATLDAAGSVVDVELVSVGKARLRNVQEPVHLYRAVLSGGGTRGLPTDPVCRMSVSAEHQVGEIIHEGRKYHFCSLRCLATFASDPDQHALPAP